MTIEKPVYDFAGVFVGMAGVSHTIDKFLLWAGITPTKVNLSACLKVKMVNFIRSISTYERSHAENRAAH